MSAAPEFDTLDEFVRDLRALRARAGDPTLEALARRTGVSKSVLSDALAGKRLPTARTVEALVRELGGDVGVFVARRSDLDTTSRSSAGAPTNHPTASPSVPVRMVRRTTSTWLAVAAGLVGVVVGAVGAAVVGLVTEPAGVAETASPPAVAESSSARITVATGEDPAATECVEDAAVVAAEDRTNDTLLEIVWSDACQAGWARITRYDGKAAGNVVSASIFREVAPAGADRQDTTEPGVQGAYTTLLVRPTPDTRVCAVGEITLAGEHISLGEPICL
ncbi:helix-turn-helix domain-containing protein [Cellulosimicrobium sp. ES-005]|uniref:Helix-turn-helix domain-containing protein n=1 Tax=Cellulosimicrobium sp. ES-005 TaxID=3163031 RepID=A0AAU8G398_9MICO